MIQHQSESHALGRSSRRVAFLAAAVLFAGSITARAADLCVDPSGAKGCAATISAAVAAANPGDAIRVHAGTYHESVVITKPLSLVGAQSGGAIIDATGFLNGVNVDGVNHQGLAHVAVTGFTVRNANAQGILVTNASYVTIDDNEVTRNDRALDRSDPEHIICPGLPDYFLAGEGFDCGEGIHLSGVNHSVVSGNHVHHNAGGILISDDTSPNHDNLITANLVEENPYDCGITLASHHFALVPTDPSVGIYHISVVGNISRRNGLAAGEGAGVGIFAGPPGAQNNANVVANNTLTDNGLPGVAMHMHAPFQSLNDHVIVGNVISGDAGDGDLFPEDEQPKKLPSMGISIFAPVMPITGIVITDNVFNREDINIAINVVPGSSIAAHLNSLTAKTGIDNMAAGTIDATLNWWKCSKGPDAPGCSSVEGSGVLTNPWLTSPVAQGAGDEHDH